MVDDLGDDTSDDDVEEEKVEMIKSETAMTAEHLLSVAAEYFH